MELFNAIHIHNSSEKLIEAIKKGADVNTFYRGYLPISSCILYEYTDMIDILIKAGADVNKKNNALNDDTPLHEAVLITSIDTVIFLLERGADPTIRNARGKLPIDYIFLDNEPENTLWQLKKVQLISILTGAMIQTLKIRRAIVLLQRSIRKAISCPYTELCRKRLLREFNEMK